MSHKFKVGDRVIIDYSFFERNTVYTIKSFIGINSYLFEENGFICDDTDIVNLAEKVVRNTKLARKMYPDHEIDGEFLRIKL